MKLFSFFKRTPQSNNLLTLNDVANATDNLPEFSFEGLSVWAKCVDVYDGDTCRIVFIYNNKLVKCTVRMLGYDSPELKGTVGIEHQQALDAKYHLTRLLKLNEPLVNHSSDVKDRLVFVKMGAWDPFGRLLATVFHNDINTDFSHSINSQMLTLPGSHPYDGGKKTWNKK